MELKDSRRLTGPNLISDFAGAIIEASFDDSQREQALELWQAKCREILIAVGWPHEQCFTRSFDGGADLVISAPMDALYAATEVNEWAFAAATAEIAGEPFKSAAQAAPNLIKMIAEESNPALNALRVAADEHNLTLLEDDEVISLGLGTGSQSWPARELPRPDQVNWQQLSDIPVAMVTGTNGKSTTVRLLATMALQAGYTAGLCSTDWIRVGDRLVDSGDYSGPGGARTLLRHPDVEMAFLETARGGLLRRGLGFKRATVATVTNVAEDHLGEYGIYNIADLARAKLVVAKGIQPHGQLVVNADDPVLAPIAGQLDCRRYWFSLSAQNPIIKQHISRGGDACYVDDDRFKMSMGGTECDLGPVGAAPLTHGGAARFNTANALAAIATGSMMGLKPHHMATALQNFASTAESNPGRVNVYQLGGVHILLDFAHNPHGMAALIDMAANLPASRRLVILGQAGDREDEAIKALGSITWRARPELVIIKEMPEHLRGRQAGEIPQLIEAGLREAGAPADVIRHVGSEKEAYRTALQEAQPGDLVLLLMHADREPVFKLLEQMKLQGWQPGNPLPLL